MNADIGEEIIFKLKQLIAKLDRIIKEKNEKELQNSSVVRL